MKYINELIDRNLKLLSEQEGGKIFYSYFFNIEGERIYADVEAKLFAEEMENRGLVKIYKELCVITEDGQEIAEKGGWLNYLERKKEADENEKIQKKLRSKLELDLAKSNLDANELNKKIASQNEKNERANKITTWINIVIGLINIGLLVWQILKPTN